VPHHAASHIHNIEANFGQLVHHRGPHQLSCSSSKPPYPRLPTDCVPPLVQVTSIDRFLRYHIQCCESFRLTKLPACSAAAGRDILTQTIILDMSGLSPMKHFTLTVRNFLHTLSQVDSVRKLPHGMTAMCLCLWLCVSACVCVCS
jgi:hypothetical protein